MRKLLASLGSGNLAQERSTLAYRFGTSCAECVQPVHGENQQTAIVKALESRAA